MGYYVNIDTCAINCYNNVYSHTVCDMETSRNEIDMRATISGDAISVGRTLARPMDSSISFGFGKLPLGDTSCITLLPGQSTWKWEGLFIFPFLTIFYPVLFSNVKGALVRRVLGMDWKK